MNTTQKKLLEDITILRYKAEVEHIRFAGERADEEFHATLERIELAVKESTIEEDLRDKLAMKAMDPIILCMWEKDIMNSDVARKAYSVADAMISERNRTEKYNG